MVTSTLPNTITVHSSQSDDLLVEESKKRDSAATTALFLLGTWVVRPNQSYGRRTSLAVREMMIDRFIETQKEHSKQDTRRVYYLSLEYLMGRLLNVNLTNLGLKEAVAEALSELGFELDVLYD